MAEEIKEEVPQETKPALVAQATEAADLLDKKLKEFAALVARQEEATAKQILGGRSMAGQEIQEQELSPIEYAKAFREGKIKGPIKADIIKRK